MRKLIALLSCITILGFSSSQAVVKDTVRDASPYRDGTYVVNYPKLTQAERNILGRTFTHQDVDIRLNRLERSVFNRTHPEMTYNQRINNLLVNYNSDSASDISIKNLSRIEQKVFRRDFSMDTAKNRIERLEENIFGAVQSGDLSARYETISRVTARLQNAEAQQQPVNTSSGWRAALGSFLMGGVPTGLTPQLSTGIDPAMTGFPDERGAGGNASYYTGNRGWGYDNRSVGTRSVVTILD